MIEYLAEAEERIKEFKEKFDILKQEILWK